MLDILAQAQTWAIAHQDRYTYWCTQVAKSPYTPIQKAEFAVISAHTPFWQAVKAWQLLQYTGYRSVWRIAVTLSNVIAPYQKARAIYTIRNTGINPGTDAAQWRSAVKLPRLGYCKASFAACLIDPLGSNVVCLDVHVKRLYGCTKTTLTSNQYIKLESEVLNDAAQLNMAPFLYQWAIWDYARLIWMQVPPCDHSFLWNKYINRRLL